MSLERETSRKTASGPVLCSSRPSLAPAVSSRRWQGKNCGEQKITLALGAKEVCVGGTYKFRAGWITGQGGKMIVMTWGRLNSVCNRDMARYGHQSSRPVSVIYCHNNAA